MCTSAYWSILNPFFANTIQNYQNTIVSIGTLLAGDAGVTVNASQILQDAKDIVTLETKIASFMVPGSSRRNYKQMYNVFNLTQLINRWPWISWQNYLILMLGEWDWKEA